jgi:activator of HSP90 ATPase
MKSYLRLHNHRCFIHKALLPAAIACFALLLQTPVFAQAKSKPATPIQTETPASTFIHQEVDFKASPQQLYAALLDTKQFSEFAFLSGEFTAPSSKIDPAVGGAFTLFDGHITGRNIELVPNERIVQAWRVVDWPAGKYSIVTFALKPQGSGTTLVFDHTSFPEGRHDGLAADWKSHYWDLLVKYLK